MPGRGPERTRRIAAMDMVGAAVERSGLLGEHLRSRAGRRRSRYDRPDLTPRTFVLAAVLLACACNGKLAGPSQSVPDAGGEGEGEGEGCGAIRCPPQSECVQGACVSVDPCRDITCEPGFVCSYGSCVNPSLDEDGDGAPVSSDCDDHDAEVGPGSVAACSSECGEGTTTCREGRWDPCTAPSDCSCAPGETRLEDCGRCGSATRACGDDGVWGAAGACSGEGECLAGAQEIGQCPDGGACSRRERLCAADCRWGEWGACEDDSECTPGGTEDEGCGDCGTHERSCGAQCLWTAFGACTGEGECTAAEVEDEACGSCGTRSRSCSRTCSWEAWGACLDGACTPGQTESQACGSCGTQERTCGADCNWEAFGTCDGQGGCAPGATETRACGNCGTQSRTCGAGCAWGNWGGCGGEGACAPGANQSEGCGNCGTRSRSCTAQCQWGGWGGCGGEGPCSPGQGESRNCDCGTESRSCNGSCQWTGWNGCPGPCGTGEQCVGSSCECGPAPHWQISGGQCLPSCGIALANAGLNNDGAGCCPGGCVYAQAGPSWDCNYCCENFAGDFNCY